MSFIDAHQRTCLDRNPPYRFVTTEGNLGPATSVLAACPKLILINIREVRRGQPVWVRGIRPRSLADLSRCARSSRGRWIIQVPQILASQRTVSLCCSLALALSGAAAWWCWRHHWPHCHSVCLRRLRVSLPASVLCCSVSNCRVLDNHDVVGV